MADPLEQVKKLLAMTASPNEDEARNAAMIACRIILEADLLVKPESPEPHKYVTLKEARATTYYERYYERYAEAACKAADELAGH